VLEYDWETSVGHWICSTSHVLRRALSVRLADEGMTLRQWEVLAWMSVKGDFTQSKLAECLGIEPHTLAGVLDRMERDGWLERRPCEEDRRRKRVHPTEKAEAVWTQAVECCHQIRDQAVRGISAAELEAFRQTCAKIRTNLGDDCGDPCGEMAGEEARPVLQSQQ